MGDAYITAVEETLSDLTGERALGAKIVSDVVDYHKLDLLVELHECGDFGDAIRALGIMNTNVWNDVRIAFQGVKTLRSIQNQSRGGFQRNLLDAAADLHLEEDKDGLQILLENMKRHPFRADIQQTSAYILLDVFVEDRLPPSVPMVTANAEEIASCLVDVLKNHDEDFEPQRAALSTLEQAVPAANRDGFPEIIAAIAPAGGIPVLFDALSVFVLALGQQERSIHDDDQDVSFGLLVFNQVVQNILHILRAMVMAETESAGLAFIEYISNHQNWTSSSLALNDILDEARRAHNNFGILLDPTQLRLRDFGESMAVHLHLLGNGGNV